MLCALGLLVVPGPGSSSGLGGQVAGGSPAVMGVLHPHPHLRRGLCKPGFAALRDGSVPAVPARAAVQDVHPAHEPEHEHDMLKTGTCRRERGRQRCPCKSPLLSSVQSVALCWQQPV